jgi:hypothetical protein
MHIESFVQGNAAGPGTVSVAGSAGGSGEGAVTFAGGGAAGGAVAPLVPHATRTSANVAQGRTGTDSEARRMIARVRVPSSRRMRQRSYTSKAGALVLAAATLASCKRGEPPQWDAGAGVSFAVVALPIDAGVVDAGANNPLEAGTQPPATGGEESGKLPQTHARPEPSGEPFDARVRALFDGIAQDDVAHAMPFFFPLSAYAQVKAIANPAADWKARLVAHYARDIHTLHAALGPNAARARFVAADVPMDKTRWVDPGEEYNRIGYFRVYGTKLRGEIDGAPVTIDVTSLISWRGEWFIVHLTGVK